MASREAACSCGQLRARVEGDPVRISICHCLACQRRSGAPFAMQARFPAGAVEVSGEHTTYVRIADEDGRRREFHFCPSCGSTVFYTTGEEPELTAIAVGAFADPSFPPPTRSSYDGRRHGWVALPEGIEGDAVWEEIRPLYESGAYAEAADRGRELLAERPGHTMLRYNVACCESLAGRTREAVADLRVALAGDATLRPQAAQDADLDPLRDDPAFVELLRT
jgi:hypothetical protein